MPIPTRFRETLRAVAAPGLWLVLGGCASDGPPPFQVEEDLVAPAAVYDLRVDTRDDSTLTLLWTSPGDDGVQGRAWRYDVRRSAERIDEESWNGATTIHGEPVPSLPGRTELFILLGLGAEERYFFALRTQDEWGNISALSNVAEAEPLDRTPPGAVSDLVATAIGPDTIELTWTATGDDGGEGRAFGYVIRYAEFELDAESFSRGTLVTPAPVPAGAGEAESFQVRIEAIGEARTVWFALQAWDEESQAGPLSNVARVELPEPGPDGLANARGRKT